MRRVVSLLFIALLTTTAAAVGNAAGAHQQPVDETHEQKIAAKAQHIGVGSNVKVTLVDGKKLMGAITRIGAMDMQVFSSDGDLLGEQTIRYQDIERIKQTGNSKAFWVILGLAIFVPLGICAAAA